MHNLYGMEDVSTSRELVLNPLLCFITSKFGKMDLKQMKEILSDFYSADNVSAAKKQLLYDAERSKLDGLLSRYPERHGDNRMAREIDDNLNIVQQLDEQNSLCSLPRYVTDNSESIPSVKLDAGDLQFLLVKLNKMESEVLGLRSLVYTLTSTIDKLVVNTSPAAVTTPADVAWPTIGQAAADSRQRQSQNNHGYMSRPSYVGNSTTASASRSVQILDNNKTALSWSQQLDNVNVPSSGVDDNDDDDGDDDGNNDGFTRYKSRRSRRSKKRKLGSPNVNDTATDTAVKSRSTADRPDRPAPAPRSTQTSRRPLLVGKRPTSNSGNISDSGFAAAKPLKLVVCVDNVDLNHDEDAVKTFVENLGVRVVSCFKVKPRQAAWQKERKKPVDHNTFRLCINKADKKLLLNSEAWPEDIVISKYFFKSSKDVAAGAPMGEAAANMLTAPGDGDEVNDDNTVLYADHNTAASTSTPSKTS